MMGIGDSTSSQLPIAYHCDASLAHSPTSAHQKMPSTSSKSSSRLRLRSATSGASSASIRTTINYVEALQSPHTNSLSHLFKVLVPLKGLTIPSDVTMQVQPPVATSEVSNGNPSCEVTAATTNDTSVIPESDGQTEPVVIPETNYFVPSTVLEVGVTYF